MINTRVVAGRQHDDAWECSHWRWPVRERRRDNRGLYAALKTDFAAEAFDALPHAFTTAGKRLLPR